MQANHLQAIVDSMSAQWQRDRAETQMTLGALIETLQAMPQDKLIFGLTHAHSYRGYYSDLAFSRDKDRRSVADTLQMAREAMGREFTGYKGGEFLMGERTPLWFASYGSTGDKIIALDAETGEFTFAPDSD